MKGNTKSMWLFASLLLATMLIGMHNAEAATVTINSPAAGGTASSATYEILVNITAAAIDVSNVTNVTLTYSTTVGGTQIFLGDNISFSGETESNLSTTSFTWDTTALTDLRTYVIYATAYNDTAGSNILIGSTSNSNVMIDNTNPTSTYGTATPTDASNQNSATLTVTSASDASLESCYLQLGTQSSVYQSNLLTNGTVATNVCTVTVSNLASNHYNYRLITSDGLDDSTLAERLINIDLSGGAGPGYIALQNQQQQSQGISQPGWIAIIAAAAIALIFLIARGYKK